MNDVSPPERGRALVIEIEYEFPVTRDRIFHRWTNADALARWFAPPGYTTISSVSDPRPGGTWRLDFRSDIDGHEYTEQGIYYRVDAPELLVLSLIQTDADGANPETLVTVNFDDVGTPEAPRTVMRFTQDGYRSIALFNDNRQGWEGCFAILAGELSERPSPAATTTR